MKKILFISPYYPPEKAAAAICVSETAKRLVKCGHQVTVLTTFPNYPTGIVPPEYRGHLVQQEMLDGVCVIRISSYVSRNKGFLHRVLSQLSFACLAPLLSWRSLGHFDLIIVQSPPLFDAIAARLLASLKHCPFIFMVSDVWPESAIQLGVLRNRVLIKISEWLEWSTYRRANLVWVVSEGVRDLLVRRGLPPEHIFLLTNGVDTKKFRPLPQAQARAELGWDDRFTILYAGNHGLVYGMGAVLDGAELLQDYANIRLVFVGDGVKKAEMMAQARKHNLRNVLFLDPVSHDRMPLLLAAADLCLIPLRKMPLLETTFPLKMFEVMACARPFILGAEGISRQLAEREAQAAICVEPENANALVSAILYLRDHPDHAKALGLRGRAFVETRFDYDQLTAALDARIATLLEKKVPGIPQAAPPSVSTATERS